MLFATALSVTLAPVLMVLLIRGRIRAEAKNPLNWLLVALYRPILSGALRVRWLTLGLAVVVVGFTAPIFSRLGAEFMPPLNEGTILYMPTTVPGLSIPESAKVLQVQDQLLTTFPEVERVFGKMGKAPTATDPAFVGMAEITVTLKPEAQWRPGMTWDRLLDEMDAKLRIPGFPNIWWMPIQTRTEMITTGVRSPVGIKVLGPDLKTIEKIGLEIEQVLANVPGTKSAFAERLNEGYYLDLIVNRREAARYGLTVGDVQAVITSAIGGETVTTTVEGRERYPVNVRYKRELRDDPDRLKRVLIPTPSGAQIPLGQIAEIVITQGPPSIADEAGALAGLVSVAVSGRDLRGYVARRPTSGARPSDITLRLPADLDRSIRASGAGRRTVKAGRPRDHWDHSLAALSQFRFAGEIADRAPVRPLRCDRGHLVSRLSGLQLERGGLGGHHRAGRRGGGDGRGHARLSRRGL